MNHVKEGNLPVVAESCSAVTSSRSRVFVYLVAAIRSGRRSLQRWTKDTRRSGGHSALARSQWLLEREHGCQSKAIWVVSCSAKALRLVVSSLPIHHTVSCCILHLGAALCCLFLLFLFDSSASLARPQSQSPPCYLLCPSCSVAFRVPALFPGPRTRLVGDLFPTPPQTSLADASLIHDRHCVLNHPSHPITAAFD